MRELENLIMTTQQIKNMAVLERSSPTDRERCLIIVNTLEADRKAFLKHIVSLISDDGEAGINIICTFRLGRKLAEPPLRGASWLIRV